MTNDNTNIVMEQALSLIMGRFDELEERLSNLTHSATEIKEVKWLNVAELCEFLPSHPREQTVYSWTSTRKIPFHKKGRSIMFDKKEIDEWLLSGSHHKSQQELEDEAKIFIEKKKKEKFKYSNI